MTAATWVLRNGFQGVSQVGVIDKTLATGLKVGSIVPADHPIYGGAEFIYLPGVAGLLAGDLVTYDTYNGTVTRWDGTANTGKPLAVAMVANVGTTTFSLYQIAGAAVVNVSGAVVAGDAAYWAATSTVKSAQVNGKQVSGMTALTASGVPAAGQAIYQVNRLTVQEQVA